MSRSIFDYALRSRDIGSLFRHLLLRQKKRCGAIPECPAPEDLPIAQLLKKLLSQVRAARSGRTPSRAECLKVSFRAEPPRTRRDSSHQRF